MKYLSVCSGIEAATVAWRPLGWEAVAFSEIEPFPAAVLAHHYPDTPNLGDMTKFKEWPNADVDVLVGGTPCQSFSVAGLRKGLDDPRGNLMLTYLAIADRYRPKWLVWENVPGVLSSNGGKDFGTFLAGLGELGYGFAYRVLDAQYFGVPQRRRRVFVVGYLGDWQRAAAVLFERHSLQGHPAPSREKREEVAPTIRAGSANGGAGHGARSGDSRDELITVVAALTANGVGTCGADDNQGQAGHLIPSAQVAHCCNPCRGQRNNPDHETMIICGTLQASGKAAGSATQQDAESGLLIPVGPSATTQYGDVAGTITARHDSSPCGDRGMNVVALPINTQIATRYVAMGEGTGLGIGLDGDPAYTLQAGHSHAVACFSAVQSSEAGSIAYQLEQSPTLRSGGSGTNMTPTLHNGMQVRRLMPIECERLQGFPDNYTQITGWNGWRDVDESTETQEQLLALGLALKKTKKGVWKVNDPDGPRYKALGNSMAVPVMRWIGKRIQMVSELEKKEVLAA